MRLPSLAAKRPQNFQGYCDFCDRLGLRPLAAEADVRPLICLIRQMPWRAMELTLRFAFRPRARARSAIAAASSARPVPNLTSSSSIKLNWRVSLQCHSTELLIATRLFPVSGQCIAEPRKRLFQLHRLFGSEPQRLFHDFHTSTFSIKVSRAETACGAGRSRATVFSGAALAQAGARSRATGCQA